MGVDGPIVVGVDAGATTTRCVVATVDGRTVSTARGPGANRWSSGGRWTQRLGEVIGSALAGYAPAQVAAGYVGLAGAGTPFPSERVAELWTELGLPGQPTVVGDAVVAYAAGSVEPDGLLLLSGTGATAAWVRGFDIAHRCDGVGWWLGDDGSAVWLARAAVRAALAALDGRGPETSLVAGVAEALLADRAANLSGRALLETLAATVYQNPPATLGRIAPIIDEHARAGDAVATAIAVEAARHLLATLAAAARAAARAADADADRPLPVVLAGSVLLGKSLVGELVADGIRETYSVEPGLAHNGAGGAAALAIRQVQGNTPTTHQAHTTLITPR